MLVRQLGGSQLNWLEPDRVVVTRDPSHLTWTVTAASALQHEGCSVLLCKKRRKGRWHNLPPISAVRITVYLGFRNDLFYSSLFFARKREPRCSGNESYLCIFCTWCISFLLSSHCITRVLTDWKWIYQLNLVCLDIWYRPFQMKCVENGSPHQSLGQQFFCICIKTPMLFSNFNLEMTLSLINTNIPNPRII